MSIFQKYLDEEGEMVLVIKSGAINHPELSVPDHHIETGLAHIFFFGERVFKQYKIVADPEHFIKGVLAPTERRHDFLQRDFTLNKHFSGGVYKHLHSHTLDDGMISLGAYEPTTPHALFEMERLDFSQNFHEQLLRGEVIDEQLFVLGQYIGESVATSPVIAPVEVNWYELASKRIDFLEQFIAWLPQQYKEAMEQANCVGMLRAHVEENKQEYETVRGEALVVSMDNHDENIFFRDGKPVFIDVVPPMESWWYGTPWLNLANVTVNVETLLSKEAAQIVEQGFMNFHALTSLPEREYAFARALAFAISVAHFGSLEGKELVAEKYIEACKTMKEWL